MLKRRILTALCLLVPLLLVVFLLPSGYFAFVSGLIVLWAGWEWMQLVPVQSTYGQAGYLVILFFLLCWFDQLPLFSFLLIALIVWVWIAAAVVRYGRHGNDSMLGFQYPMVKKIVGLFLLCVCWEAINTLFQWLNGRFWLLFVLMIIWGMDTGAYFSGRLWGKRKLIPRVSPKKTWEGVWGGSVLVLVIIVMVFMGMYVRLQWYTIFPFIYFFALSLITVAFSVMGDLFESMLKRHLGIKDSGHLLPGHGGVLDRIDSVLAGIPIFVLGFYGFQSLMMQ